MSEYLLGIGALGLLKLMFLTFGNFIHTTIVTREIHRGETNIYKLVR